MKDVAENAREFSKKSNDKHTKVGAALLTMRPDGVYRVVSYGHNQIIDRGDDSSFERPKKYERAIHAEVMAIGKAARLGHSTDTAVLYVTHPPCLECCKLIVASGISAVIVGNGSYVSDSAEERQRAEFMLRDVFVMGEDGEIARRIIGCCK